MQPQQKGAKYQALQSNIEPELRALWQQEQNKLKQHIILQDDMQWNADNLDLVCGVDLSAHVKNTDFACVGLVVWSVKEKEIVYEDYEFIEISQPYVPGYLAFREVPTLYPMFQKLKATKPQLYPQLVIVDGNGILHQNQCGLASHLGVLLGVPTVGVGKTLFYIDGLTKDKVKQICEQEIKNPNDFALLKGDSGRVWGAGLRNGKNATNPVFVSIGTKISLETAIRCVIKVSEFRVPEPVRLADKKSRELIENIDIGNNLHLFKKYDMVYLENL